MTTLKIGISYDEKAPDTGGKPIVRLGDDHTGCSLDSGKSADMRVTTVRVNGKQPTATGGATKCLEGAAAAGPGASSVILKGGGTAIAVGHPTMCGGVHATGSDNVHLVPKGGGWGKAVFDWLNQKAKPEDNARLNAIANIEKSISFALKASIAAAAPEPTVTKAGTVFLTGQAINIGVPAVKQLFTGKPEEPLLDQGIDKAGSKFGLSAEQTNLAKQIANTAGGFVGGKLEGGARINNIAKDTGKVAQAGTTNAAKKTGLPDWLKKLFQKGNDFNKANRSRYPYNEIEVIDEFGNKFRVDSFDPIKREIVSRKFTQLNDVKPATGVSYLYELNKKYPSGATISNSPFNPNILKGTLLKGDQILEIPVQNGPIPKSVLDYAEKNGIVIRDVTGHIYENPLQ